MTLTVAARRWQDTGLNGVVSRRDLRAAGVTRALVSGHVRARRWQVFGSAVLLHNAEPTREEWTQIVLLNCGPRSALTSFTGMEGWGMQGWFRRDVHVLVPAGTRHPSLDGVVLHRAVDWNAVDVVEARRLHRPAPALIVAAGGTVNVRTACGVLAAGVQQRLVTAKALITALDRQPKLRHFRALRLALYDIEQGAEALSEIDLAGLCRRFRLPPPEHQAVRREPNGRRRYLDARWRRRDGGLLTVEIDGALHLGPLTWADDQLRQNEVMLGGSPVLRFPTVLVRSEQAIVADQIGRGLLLHPT